ncbi:MAG: DoxX family protein [Bacteroidota bacterium]
MNNKSKTQKIIYWSLTALVAFVFSGSAMSKLMANPEAIKMAAGFGIDESTYTLLGIIELTSVILFVIPRTGVIGTILLAAYMGGAIATHVQHGISVVAPCIVQAVMLLVAFYRFPELRSTLLYKTQ